MPFPLLDTDQNIMPENIARMAYRERLNRWAIATILADGQRTIVCRYRSQSDAEGHLQRLRQLKPHDSFVVVFDPHPQHTEPVTAAPQTKQEAVI